MSWNKTLCSIVQNNTIGDDVKELYFQNIFLDICNSGCKRRGALLLTNRKFDQKNQKSEVHIFIVWNFSKHQPDFPPNSAYDINDFNGHICPILEFFFHPRTAKKLCFSQIAPTYKNRAIFWLFYPVIYCVLLIF